MKLRLLNRYEIISKQLALLLGLLYVLTNFLAIAPWGKLSAESIISGVLAAILLTLLIRLFYKSKTKNIMVDIEAKRLDLTKFVLIEKINLFSLCYCIVAMITLPIALLTKNYMFGLSLIVGTYVGLSIYSFIGLEKYLVKRYTKIRGEVRKNQNTPFEN